MQSVISEIRSQGADVLAISADTPAENAKTTRKHGLQFTLVSDSQQQAMEAFGTRHPKGGIGGTDIARPAAFLIDRQGTVLWQKITPNWRQRLRPEEALEALRLER